MRINMSLVSIFIVDAWIAYNISTGTEDKKSDFYLALAEEMIENTY